MSGLRTPDTADPNNGRVGRDPVSGALTGMLIESAAKIVEHYVAQSGHYTPEMDRAAMAHSISTLNSFRTVLIPDS